jgi:hypothetical protein
MKMTKRLNICHAAVWITLTGCGALTREEAHESLEELKLSSQAQALTSGAIELTTSFSIGNAVAAAAQEVRSFVSSQLPCAEIEVSAAQLSIEYGANGGSCLHRGQQYQGSHLISIARNQMDEVIVDHVWTGTENGTLRLDGTASVTWSLEDRSRRVVHSALWTRLSDGRSGEGSGNRVQRPLEDGIFAGFSVDGTRAWHGDGGAWSLDIEDVSMRWVDPVPESGMYTLETPFDKTVTARFLRRDATTIDVEIRGSGRAFDFEVRTLP